MRSVYVVVDIADGPIYRVEIVLPRRNRDCSFVTSENYWNKHGTVGLGIFADDVLIQDNVISPQIYEECEEKGLTAWFQTQSPDIKFLHRRVPLASCSHNGV